MKEEFAMNAVPVIPGYQPGANVLLLNTVYVKPHPMEDGKWSSGTMCLTYRDLDTGEKGMCEIKDPQTHTYITKPNLRNSFKTQRAFMKIDDVDVLVAPYRFMEKAIKDKIAEDGVDMSYVRIYNDAVETRRSRMKKEVYKWRHSYYADYDINDYFHTQAAMVYNPTKMYITKSYFDIETDVYTRSKDEHDGGECPISAISMVIEHDSAGKKLKAPMVFTLLLRNHDRYSQQEYFEEHMDKFIDECHDEFDKKYGKCKYTIKVYDKEIDLIKQFFGLVHTAKSDFLHVWNMSYDVNYITKRLQFLGYNPIDFFCHPDFSDSYMNYYVDKRAQSDLPNRCDFFDCTCYSRYIDQMLNYAGIRKSKSDYGGQSLDNVSKLEIKSEKRVYDGLAVDVINGAIYEYWNFVKYSINDTLLQYGLENKLEDTQAIFEQAYTGGTRLSKVLKQSVYLKDVYAMDYFGLDIVPKNNCNLDYCDDGQTMSDYDRVDLPGALVGDPMLNEANGVVLFGKPSKFMYKIIIDFDFAAMYPNAKIKFNICEHGQYFRLIILTPTLDNENPLSDLKFMRGGKFVDDLGVRDWSKMARHFNIPEASTLMEEFAKKRKKVS
jgi:DNA polymerase elongation subunit (family B)